jgi:Protein of unknown function (DUF1569)
MKSFDQPEVQAEVYARFARLEPSSQRQWGKMTAHQAIMHLTDSLHAVTGERAMNLPPLPPLMQLIQRWGALSLPIPWPRGIKTAPVNDQELQGSKPMDFARDKAALLERSKRVGAGQVTWITSHPMLGRMTERQWQRWAYLHFDHHLRQFGV